MDMSLLEWLNLPCDESEVIGDVSTGFYLSFDTISKKLAIMRKEFEARIHYTIFQHSLYFRPTDKATFSSGTLQMEILGKSDNFHQKLVGAYTHNVTDYDNEKDRNEQYAGTTKTLCIRNALSNEYPQFGSLLNKLDFDRTIQLRTPGETSDKIKKSIQNLPK